MIHAWHVMITEFLKGHLCFLPFNLYSINTLLFNTSHLLFYLIPPSITIPGFTIYHFQSTFIFTFYHFQFNITCTIYRLCFTIYHFLSTCTFIYFIIMFYTFYYPKFNKASVTIRADFSPEFNPPIRWRSKHQTKNDC